MALSPLTISVSSGVQGRSFKSAVSGVTTGNVVEVIPGGSSGFGYSNGFLTHNGLPADTNLAVLRERNPTTGENLTTNLIITAASAYAVAQKASALDATYRTYRIAPVTQGDGSQIWNVFTDGQTGATLNTPVNGAVAPTLGTLTLSGALQIGTAASGTIIGATAGSTITGNIPGITINSGARTYSGTPTGSAGTISNGLVEALAGATNTPNNSSITVAAAAVTLSALTLSPLTATAGVAYSGTISGNTSGSTITATSSDGTALSVSGTTVTGTFAGAGSPTITLTETLAGATNTPRVSTGTMVVSSSAANTFDTTTGWFFDSTISPTFDRTI